MQALNILGGKQNQTSKIKQSMKSHNGPEIIIK